MHRRREAADMLDGLIDRLRQADAPTDFTYEERLKWIRGYGGW